MPKILRQLAENVWIFPHDKNPKRVQPNVGIICTATQTVLVDCGNSPHHARRIQTALERIDAPPISHIIYTHHHWDHVFGACVFDVPVIAHDSFQISLAHYIQQRGGLTHLQEQIQQYTPGLTIEDWNNFQIVNPSITFSRTLTLPLDGITLELEHVGGAHAADSIVVRVKERSVMFLGDCYYPPPRHQESTNQKTSWSMLSSFFDEEAIDIYVAGHENPFRRSETLRRWCVKLLARL